MQPPGTEPRRGTLLHRAAPRSKLGAALIIIVGIILLPRRLELAYLAPTGLLFVLWFLSRMPWRYGLKRLLVAEFFILGIALLSVLTPSALPMLLSAVAKSNLCVFTMLLLTWTTPFHEILQVLRSLRMPTVMLTTLALMCRYLPVLTEESRRMQRARASRTYSRRRRVAWQSLAMILGHLFVRSADRAERIYLAMCSRGWK